MQLDLEGRSKRILQNRPLLKELVLDFVCHPIYRCTYGPDGVLSVTAAVRQESKVDD